MSEYRIEIRASLMPFPIVFFPHCFIVVSKNNHSDRYEVFMPLPGYRELSTHYYGNIYKNALPIAAGMAVYPTTSLDSRWRFPSWVVSSVSGAQNSIAHDIYCFIESDRLKQYPYKEEYNMVFGANSNTFVQWFIDQFPESNLKLPFLAWGKKYGSWCL